MPGPLRPAAPDTGASSLPGLLRRAVRFLLRLTSNRWLLFPRRLVPFAIALDAVAEPADIWHGRLIGSLPAVVRQSRRLGGAAIYDSGDIYTKSRELAQDRSPYPRLVLWAERRWARACRLVMTANEDYAEVLERLLGVPRPTVIFNCSPRWTPPDPAPDLIRERLGLGPGTRVVLYQGGLFTDRGIEQAMRAVLRVEDAVLAIMGWGTLRELLTERVTRPPYAGRVHMLDPVPPTELLAWSASADVMVICIQPTSLNHRLSTPNKLFEALAAGVPVVASDLPGMARIVRETEAGALCDPTDPAAIANALRSILDAPAEERAARQERILATAHARYSWEDQEVRLLDAYRRLLPEPGAWMAAT
jgi:glycosyltransferase involved in cell wall biosynthesis